MKNLVLIALVLLATLYTRAANQLKDDSLYGIHFQQCMSWNQIVAKAKKERKFIFVDCFATWCAPCKKMEREVYSLERVGEYFNAKFLSVKVQMDTSKSDDQAIRTLYHDAHELKDKYKINLYPTLLFFNPEGNILRRAFGAMEAADLIRLAADVVDPGNDFYALLDSYKKGRRNLDEMAFLAKTSENLLQDTTEARTIARDYIVSLKKDDWYSRTNIEFMREFTYNTRDIGFNFVYQNVDSIDKIMKDESYAQVFIQSILYWEFARPEMLKSSAAKVVPDWTRIAAVIGEKYDSYYAERVITSARTEWAGKHNDWPEHTKYLVEYIEKFGPKSDSGGPWVALYLNNCAWDIFQHSADVSELNIALKWSSHAIIMDPTAPWMDTFANLLYKLGNKDRALSWEVIAVKLGQGNEEIAQNYEKMKAGEPTWK